MDKVIIDGVDVSDCEHYRAEIETKMPYGEYETQKDKCYYSGIEVIQNCKGNKGCIYKQLKRKEQECERLKAILEPFYKPDVIKVLTDYKTGELQLQENKLNKYKQALQEIREIAEKMYNTNDEDTERDLHIELQAKINEVIGAE